MDFLEESRKYKWRR